MIPYFSIIIPTLNEEHYLPHLLSDLSHQQEKNFEVIIVDGKSEDRTQDIAKEFEKVFPVTIVESSKRNVSYQRNVGAASGKGDVYIFLDADTRVEKDFTKVLKAAFARKGTKLFLPSLLPDEKTKKAKLLISLVNSFIRASQYYGRPLSTGGNFFVEKGTFKKIGGFNEDVYISEDHEFIHRAYKKGIKAKILKSPKVVVSMRRSKVEGDATLIYKYIVGFLMYTMNPSEKSLKTKFFEYEMGGHRYLLEDGVTEKEKKKYLERFRQLLQLGVVIAFLKYFKF